MWAAEYMGWDGTATLARRRAPGSRVRGLFHGRLTVHEHPERDVARARLTARGNPRKLWPIFTLYNAYQNGRCGSRFATASDLAKDRYAAERRMPVKRRIAVQT